MDMFADVRHVLEKVLALVNHHPVEELVETKVDGNRTQPLKGYVAYPSDVRCTNKKKKKKKKDGSNHEPRMAYIRTEQGQSEDRQTHTQTDRDRQTDRNPQT